MGSCYSRVEHIVNLHLLAGQNQIASALSPAMRQVKQMRFDTPERDHCAATVRLAFPLRVKTIKAYKPDVLSLADSRCTHAD